MLVDLNVVLQAVKDTNASGQWGTACIDVMLTAILSKTRPKIRNFPKVLTTEDKVRLMMAQHTSDMQDKIKHHFRSLGSYPKGAECLLALIREPFYVWVKDQMLCARECKAIEAHISDGFSDDDEDGLCS